MVEEIIHQGRLLGRRVGNQLTEVYVSDLEVEDLLRELKFEDRLYRNSQFKGLFKVASKLEVDVDDCIEDTELIDYELDHHCNSLTILRRKNPKLFDLFIKRELFHKIILASKGMDIFGDESEVKPYTTVERVRAELNNIRDLEVNRYKISETRTGVMINRSDTFILLNMYTKGSDQNRYEIYPVVRGKNIQELFGKRKDHFGHLTIEEASDIAEHAATYAQNTRYKHFLEKEIEKYVP
ncbi:MAG: hypothetical protein KKH52_00135, partial [Nanoarchaeota archaeon]|nr:hypothetical protein [Nanoarchaeota archaeon]